MKLPRFGKMEFSILFVTLVALAFLIWVYNYWLIWEEKEINLGPTKEARSNPFYAAQKFLENTDILSNLSYSPTAFENMQVAEEKIGPQDTIVLLQGRGVIYGERFTNLWAWVEAGGTLIMSTENPYFGEGHKEDELFTRLGLSAYDWDDEDLEDWDEDTVADESPEVDEETSEHDSEVVEENFDAPDEEIESETETTQTNYLDLHSYHCLRDEPIEIIFKEEPRPLAVAYGWESYFYADGMEPANIAKRDPGYAFVSYEIGEGKIFVNASNQIWQNELIACHDHAYFLRRLVAASPKVWFVVNKEAPSLFNLVWKGIPLAVIALLLALVLSLWRALIRFGPIFPDIKIERRSFAEHIKAGANFLWRNGLQEQLVEQLRKDIASSINRRNPGFDKMRDVDKKQCLLKHFDMSVEDIEHVYFVPYSEVGKKDFVNIMAKLKNMKEQL